MSVLACGALLTACIAAAPPPAVEPAAGPAAGGTISTALDSQRLIVRWASGAPATAARLAALAQALGGEVSYVRAMSGGAHLVRVSAPRLALDRRLRTLGEQPGIDYVVLEGRRRVE